MRIRDVILDKISGEWGTEDVNGKGVKVLRTTNFSNDGRLSYDNVATRVISNQLVEKKRLLHGDVIIEKSGGSPTQPVGRVVFFDNDENIFLCNNFTTILRPSNKIFPRYFFYDLFYKHLSKRTLKYQNKTTGIINLQLDRYLDEDIKVPSLNEQRKIVKFLDTADSLRQKRKEQLTLLDDYLKSVFLDMFGDPVINEKGWKYRKLPLLISKAKNSLKRGPFGGALKKEIFVDDGYLIYEQNHALNNDYSFKRYFIDENTFNTLRAFEVKSGDVLISCSGVYLGKLSIVPQGASPGIINQALLKITLNTEIMLQIFFVYVFSHPTFKTKYICSNRGSGIPNLPPMSIMKEINFIAPPIELQKKFADIVKQVEQTKQKMLASLDEMDNHFNALMQRCFG
jgi:type I restriction enzyme S subunit